MILPGQKIHASLAFQSHEYEPKAVFSALTPNMRRRYLAGAEFRGVFNPEWAPYLERDIFDLSIVTTLAEVLTGDTEGSLHILHRLSFLVDYRKLQFASVVKRIRRFV